MKIAIIAIHTINYVTSKPISNLSYSTSDSSPSHKNINLQVHLNHKNSQILMNYDIGRMAPIGRYKKVQANTINPGTNVLD